MRKLLIVLAAFLVFGQVYELFAGSVDETAEIAKRKEARQNKNYEKAVFAGGCFWCVQPPYDYLDGVITTTVGFTGGTEVDPTYREVAGGKTSHTEAVEVIYDPEKVGYDKLVEIFWRNINPTDAGGQFVDRGSQYRPGIFYVNEEQKKAALASKKKLEESGRYDKPVVVEITEATPFYDAEEYHQKYYIKSPVSYKTYRVGSGRDKFLEKVWGASAKK
jgi:methionine-S-sulfoxide reductase